VQVVQVDVVNAQPLQGPLTRRPDVRRVAPHVLLRTHADHAELGGQHNDVPPVGDGPPDQFLVGAQPVVVGGVQ
jgi:hypothetical protein